MDDEAWAFFSLIIFAAVLGAIVLIVYFLTRKYRSNPNPEAEYEVYLNESSVPVSTLFKRIASTPLLEIRASCGDEAYSYLFLHQMLARYFTILTIFIFLMGIYSAKPNSEDLKKIAFENIQSHKDFLAAPLIIFIFNILLWYYMMHYYSKNYLQSGSSSNIDLFAVRATGLPEKMTRSDLKSKLQSFFDENHNIYIVPRMKKVQKYQKKLELAEEQLQHAQDYENVKSKRLMKALKCFCCKKVDAIDYWEKKVENNKRKLLKKKEKAETCNSGVAIISYSSILVPKDIQKLLKPYFPGIEVTQSYIQSDIKWENIDAKSKRTTSVSIVGTIVFFILFIIVLSPSYFILVISFVVSDLGPVETLLEAYIPTISLILFISVVLPMAINALVNAEHRASKSAEITSTINKYLLFQFFYVVVIPAMGMQLVNLFANLDNADSLAEEAVSELSNNSVIFTVFMANQALFSNALDLLQVGRIAVVRLKVNSAVSDRERYNAYLPNEFQYPQQYSYVLIMATIVLAYHIIYPLILLFGLIYFWFRVIFI